MQNIKRKQETRNKIMMGGLIIKAGLENLHEQDKATLLGLLIDAKSKLDQADKSYIDHITNIGNKAFKAN